MGAWGYSLYDNDLALDISQEFGEALDSGKTAEEITEKLLGEYGNALDIPAEAALFWMALADTQWERGMLLPQVKFQALYWIEKSEALHPQWEKTLEDLRRKLLTVQPPRQKSRNKKLYRCPWKAGDVFAFPMESNLAESMGFRGRYLLLQKVGQTYWYPGHTIPVVYVKMTRSARLPDSRADYDALEYVQTWFVRYEERFWPVDMSRPEEDIREKSRLSYPVDEYGYLPIFRLELLNTSPKAIPRTLIYVGNFSQTLPPEKEFVPFSMANLPVASWGELEEKMLRMYCGHNLRGLPIYPKATGTEKP